MVSWIGIIFLSGAFFSAPVLAALFAAALMLPRMFLGWYAFYAIAAILIFVKVIDAQGDGRFAAGLGTFVLEVLAIGAVIVGLLTRCVLEVVRRSE